MTDHSLCAVIVTHRPQAAVLENLAKVRPQVEALMVVDNGSPSELLCPLQQAARDCDFTLIENRSNAGIAAALNTGVRWAQGHGFRYVLLFDQDSTVTDGFSDAMLASYLAHPSPDKVALVTPNQVERSSGLLRSHRWAKDGTPLIAITSGSLMPLKIFDRCGWFQEDLIIDCVDHEYCLRARALGYTLAVSREARLMVAVGEAQSHRAFGLTLRARHYSATRRYYLTRNRLVMVLRFWKQQPAWCCHALQDICGDAIKIVLVEKDSWTKTRNTARGIYDALCGRMGKVVEL